MNEIEKQVLKRVTPSNKYRKNLKSIISEIKSKLKEEIINRKLKVSIELVGSTAKDTYLKDNLDIDFFLSFPIKFPKEEIAKNTLSIGKKLLKDTEESYAEHPYIRGYYNDFYVEIVPCYKIENASQKLSAVDRTPLHTKFIKENLEESQKSDVRLLKQFLMGIGCYGAEAEIEGFSGYLCEIIVLKYFKFKKVLENAQNWKSGEKLALSKGNYENFDTSLTFIDPVDTNRNVASAVSIEKFNLFIDACKEYLTKPSIKFFFPSKIKPWPLEKINKEIKKQNYLYLGIEFVKPKIIDENLYPQIRKSCKSIWQACERYGFTLYDISFHIDDETETVYIIIKSKYETLSDTYQHKGPPVKLKENANEFINRWKDEQRVTKRPYKKDDRLYVELKRDYTNIKHFLSDQIKGFSMGRHIDKIVKKNYKVLEKKDLIIPPLAEFWTQYLDKKKSWER